mmetsp:Transcript_12823/g.37223  ORF Transcript_12823/g.37223 Transcript_12823/m.37223 type:complete len:394 (-) Transcript_12823:1369-2550(-)
MSPRIWLPQSLTTRTVGVPAKTAMSPKTFWVLTVVSRRCMASMRGHLAKTLMSPETRVWSRDKISSHGHWAKTPKSPETRVWDRPTSCMLGMPPSTATSPRIWVRSRPRRRSSVHCLRSARSPDRCRLLFRSRTLRAPPCRRRRKNDRSPQSSVWLRSNSTNACVLGSIASPRHCRMGRSRVQLRSVRQQSFSASRARAWSETSHSTGGGDGSWDGASPRAERDARRLRPSVAAGATRPSPALDLKLLRRAPLRASVMRLTCFSKASNAAPQVALAGDGVSAVSGDGASASYPCRSSAEEPRMVKPVLTPRISAALPGSTCTTSGGSNGLVGSRVMPRERPMKHTLWMSGAKAEVVEHPLSEAAGRADRGETWASPPPRLVGVASARSGWGSG